MLSGTPYEYLSVWRHRRGVLSGSVVLDIQELMLNFHPRSEYSDPQVQILDHEKTDLALIGMVANDYTHKPIKKNIA